MVDIKQILTEHKIPFVTQGVNTKRGELSISCPYCKDDPSKHMGVDPNTGWFACWRDKSHSGKNIHRLLALLNIYITADHNDVMQQLVNRTYFGNQEIDTQTIAIATKKVTKLPTEFIPIEEESFFTRPYLQYLKARG